MAVNGLAADLQRAVRLRLAGAPCCLAYVV